MNVVSLAMTGLSAPTASAGAAIVGAINPGAATGGTAGEGTAGTGSATGVGTASGAANGAANGTDGGAANCASADPTVITGRMTEMTMIIAAAPAAMMQRSVSELLLSPKVLKQPMPVRELGKEIRNSA